MLPGESQLDQALQDLQVGDTMQQLGTVNGVAIYAARTAAGHICLQGIAADGIAAVAFTDADGNVLDSTPVTNNLFASSTRLGLGAATYVEALDTNGTVVWKKKLAG